MAISTRTRKELWAKSGNRCAICRIELVSSEKLDNTAIVGDECHIVGREIAGPRGNHSLPLAARDDFNNLLLLCPNHHRLVDENVDTFTIGALTDVKNKHEKWVKDSLSSVNIIRSPSTVLYAMRVDKAKYLTDVVCGAHAAYFENDQPEREEDATLVGNFLQNVNEASDLWSDISLANRVSTQFGMQKDIEELKYAGWLVYVASKDEKLREVDFVLDPAPNSKTFFFNFAYVLVLTTHNKVTAKKDNKVESLMRLPDQLDSSYSNFVPILRPANSRFQFI